MRQYYLTDLFTNRSHSPELDRARPAPNKAPNYLEACFDKMDARSADAGAFLPRYAKEFPGHGRQGRAGSVLRVPRHHDAVIERHLEPKTVLAHGPVFPHFLAFGL